MSFCKHLLCAPLIIFAGCMVGPRYHIPSVNLPEKFSQQQKIATANLADWWTFFQDPYLDSLIKKAVENNYDLRLAIEKIEETRAAFLLQNAKLYPEIDATGTLSRSRLSKNLNESTSSPSYNQTYIQTGLDTSWEIDFWGKLTREKNAAFNIYQAQIETMRDVYVILLSDVARTYIDCRTFQKKIALIDQQIEIDTQLLKLTGDRFDAGIASKPPDLNALATLHESKNQRIILEIHFKQAVNRLALLLGQNPEEFSLDEGKHHVPQSTKTLNPGLPSQLLQRRPDIRRAEMLLKAATESVGAAVAQYFPSFSLLGDSGLESNKISKWLSSGSFSWSIGPSVRWPIITFGRIKFKIDETKSVERQALLSYGQSVINALGDVENAMVAYFKGKDRVQELEEKLSAADKEHALTKALLESGLTNKTEVLLAHKNYLTIALDVTDAQQEESLALITAYKALGGGW
ncbi:MAG: efflux transporter outer membrane subunit [Candidatus Babeliales bacterium]